MVTAIADLAGKPSQLLVLSREITQRRAAQQERERFTQELERSNQELSQFSHMVAHDLQAPVRTIRTFVELLIRNHGNDGDEGIRAMILTAAGRMQDLIQSLLSYAEVGNGEIHRTAIDIKQSVRMVEVALKSMIKESKATLRYGSPPIAAADESMVTQLIQNLVSNAIKYRRPNVAPIATVSARAVTNGWEFAVQDNGQGIPAEYRDTIFKPLKHLHGAEIAGTGSGLALCAAIVDRHGGQIRVASNGESGSTFFFTLLS